MLNGDRFFFTIRVADHHMPIRLFFTGTAKKEVTMTKFDWVYMTAASFEEARSIGKALVESRLAACVNILDPMTSIYRWEGEIREDREVALIAKTVNTRVPDLIQKVKSMHSYKCPCILALPAAAGNLDFFRWIEEETA
jgi:periplasmic divalent cation tolerance protein